MESSSYGEDQGNRRPRGAGRTLSQPAAQWRRENAGKRFQLRGDIGRSHTPNACAHARLLPAEPYSLVDERNRNAVVALPVGGTTLFAAPKRLG
jgi:hypothetical protein